MHISSLYWGWYPSLNQFFERRKKGKVYDRWLRSLDGEISGKVEKWKSLTRSDPGSQDRSLSVLDGVIPESYRMSMRYDSGMIWFGIEEFLWFGHEQAHYV